MEPPAVARPIVRARATERRCPDELAPPARPGGGLPMRATARHRARPVRRTCPGPRRPPVPPTRAVRRTPPLRRTPPARQAPPPRTSRTCTATPPTPGTSPSGGTSTASTTSPGGPSAAALPPRLRTRLLSGGLTVRLAERCDRVVACDRVESAVATARERTSALPHVDVRHLTVPDQWPSGGFDLIVLSELLYYSDAPPSTASWTSPPVPWSPAAPGHGPLEPPGTRPPGDGRHARPYGRRRPRTDADGGPPRGRLRAPGVRAHRTRRRGRPLAGRARRTV
ncbi:hypothetical protein SCALM49S_06418 [Streptomyces californicus]